MIIRRNTKVLHPKILFSYRVTRKARNCVERSLCRTENISVEKHDKIISKPDAQQIFFFTGLDMPKKVMPIQVLVSYATPFCRTCPCTVCHICQCQNVVVYYENSVNTGSIYFPVRWGEDVGRTPHISFNNCSRSGTGRERIFTFSFDNSRKSLYK